MPDDKRPLKVFLCHAHADREPVRALYNRLVKDGVDAWFDKEKLLPGQDWEYEIRKAVREADVVVVCLSKQFNQAGFRQKEVRLSLDTAMEKPEGEIFIIPARLEECDNLESLRKWHWVDLFENDGYKKLVSSFELRATAIGKGLLLAGDASEKEIEIVENEVGKYTTKIRLQVNNLDNVFTWLLNRLRKKYPGTQQKTKMLDGYSDGVVRKVTYINSLMSPNRVGNKVIMRSNYYILVFPGKNDVNVEEMTDVHEFEAITFTGWETRTVLLELEYMPIWHEMIKPVVLELYDLFGRYDKSEL